MTKFNFYDKNCHGGLKKKNFLVFDAATIFKKNNVLI